ncbi:MAG: LUD domain-containing protein [Tepidisphaeraceae bacterium]
MSDANTDFLTHIAHSLGRASVPSSIPMPPAIDESITRLVRGDVVDLVGKFVEQARAVKLYVELLASEAELALAIVKYLREKQLTRLVVTRCEQFDRLDLIGKLNESGIEAKAHDEVGLDKTYDVDAGLTDVYAAVAETGSIVMKRSPQHGLAASLVPMTHLAVVRREQVVADLIDLMRKLKQDGTGSGVTIITGPSKTADIEMNLVTGVHGPGVVMVFVV